MRHVRWLPILLVPLLAACVDDRAAYRQDDEQVFTLIREQPQPWSPKVKLALVVSRMPECSRRHVLGEGTAQTRVDLWQYRPDTYVIQVGERRYATETRTCEGWEKLTAEPPGGMGVPLGGFVEKDGKLRFVPAKPAGS